MSHSFNLYTERNVIMAKTVQKSGNEKQKIFSHWKEINSCNITKNTENLLNASEFWLKWMWGRLSAV